jgi:hypothetical protein
MERKNDSTLEVNCKRTTLAVLTIWFIQSFKRAPKSKSELIRTVMEEAERSTIESGISEPVETIEEAEDILNEAGIGGLNRYDRGKRGLAFNMKVEDGRINRSISQRDIDEALRLFKENNKIVPTTEQDFSAENLKRVFRETLKNQTNEVSSTNSPGDTITNEEVKDEK